MKTGDTFALNVDKLQPDWVNEWDMGDADFNPMTVFHKSQWQKEENYMQIVRERENISLTGDRGNYIMQPNFNIVIVAAYVSDEACDELLQKLPFSEQFAKFVIE